MKRSRVHLIFLTVVITCLSIVLALLIQLPPDSIQNAPKNISLSGWSYGLVWAGAIVCAAILTVAVMFIKERFDSTDQTAQQTIYETKDQRLRREFLSDLLGRYEGQRAHKLDGRSVLPLVISDASENTKPGQFEDAGQYLIRRYERTGRLLLVGDRGSGKTVLLLRLAEYLAKKAQQDLKEPLPVILNVASWSPTYIEFNQWVAAMLTKGYGLSAKDARNLIDSKDIAFLLDGLDELAHNNKPEAATRMRMACLSSLAKSLHHGSISVVICCRLEQFNLLRQQPDLPRPWSAELTVEKLSPAQIDLALIRVGAEKTDRFAASKLNIALGTNNADTYQQVLSNLFYFTTALQVLDEGDAPVLCVLSKERLEEDLVRAFINKKLQRTKSAGRFSRTATLDWLTWLALFLNERVTFELSDLQPSLLGRKWLYRVLFTFIYAALGWLVLSSALIQSDRFVAIPLLAMIAIYVVADGIGDPILQRMRSWNWSRWRNIFFQSFLASVSFASLFFILSVWTTGVSKIRAIDLATLILISVVYFPFGFAMFTGSSLLVRMSCDLTAVISDKIVAEKILTEEFANWKLPPLNTAREWRDISIQAFGFAVAAATVIGAAGAVFWIVSSLTDKNMFKEGITLGLWLVASITPAFICLGAFLGAVYGTIFGLLIGVIRKCRRTASFAKISSPYQRLRSGITFNTLSLFVVLAAMVFIPRLLFEFHATVRAPVFRELAVPILATSLLGFFKTAIFKHFILRVCFSLERAMPLRYAHFLSYATELRVLEQHGGEWRFRHQILQDHFARRAN